MNKNKKAVKKFRVQFVSALVILSLVTMVIMSIPVSACHYTVGTYESDYLTEKVNFLKGETVYGRGNAYGYSYFLKLRIRDPDDIIVYYSNEAQYEVTGSYFLNYSAKTGVWNIQLGINNSGWKWPTNPSSNRNSYFTVSDANFTLTVNANGNGSVDKDPDQTYYAYGSVVNLTAIPDAGWSFNHWGDNLSGNDNPKSIVMDSNKTVTAHFVQNQYILNISVDGNGSVIKDPDQPYYTYGSVVNLTAVPDSGWVFDHWAGDLTGNDNPVSITIDNDKNITAIFDEPLYIITVNVDEEGSGYVDIDPAVPYHHGDVVNLTAIPFEGYTFDHWSGDLNSNDYNESIVMDSNKTVTAHFIQNKYNLTINIQGNGYVNKNPDQENYSYGTIVNLTAISESGWVFDHWSGDLSGNNGSEEVNMTDDKNVTAHFKVSESNGGSNNGGGNGGSRPKSSGAEPNSEPVAIAGGPYYGFIDEIIEFNGSQSYDIDQYIISYNWDFGDGYTGKGEIITHFYSYPGEYKVVLMVKDSKGASNTNETVVIIIQPNRPPSDPNISGPTEGSINIEYTYSIVSTDEDNDNINYIINWGDGTQDISGFQPSGEFFYVTHKWTKSGKFTIKVTAEDNITISTNELKITIDEPRKPDIPEEYNICLVILLILTLLLLLLLLYLSERRKRKGD